MLTRLWNKLTFPFRRRRITRELDEEVAFHRHMLEAQEEQRGADHEAAVLHARRRMGNTTVMREDARDAWVIRWLDAFSRDVKYCLRVFARSPAFSIVAVLTLALGIGANAAIFRLVDAVLLRALPVDRPGELLVLRGSWSYPRFERLRDRNAVFTGVIGAHTLSNVELRVQDQPLGNGFVALVSANYFSLLGVRPAIGRTLEPADDRAPGASPVAVISDGFWTRGFGRSPDVLGRTLHLRGGSLGGASTSGFEQPGAPPTRDVTALTIVGIAPPGFFGDSVGTSIDVWVPIMMQPALMPGRAWLTRDTASWVRLLGRLRPGVTEEQARVALTTLARQIRTEELGGVLSDEQKQAIAGLTVNAESGARGFGGLRRQAGAPLVVLAIVVALVLLIACLNVANLLLARATARRHEIAMRLSLGASRGRLVRQLLTESFVLSILGGGLGLAVAAVSTQALVALVSTEGQRITLPFDADWRVLTVTAALSLASGLIFGLAPAWRGTTAGLHGTMKDAARTTGSGRTRLTRTLVGGQVAVSLMLLIAAGLFLRTLVNLKSQIVGYDRDGLIVMRLDPVGAGYRGDAIGTAAVDLMNRFSAIPGVRSATFSENGLFSGTESGTQVEITGYTPAREEDRIARFDQAGPGYFTNVGIPLMLGRDFAESDRPAAPRVTIINDAMARFYFGDRNTIGQHVRVSGPSDVTLEIIGVARDARDHTLREAPQRRFYVSYLQPIDGITTVNFEIRAAGNPGAIFGPIRDVVRQFDRNLQVLSLKTADSLIDDSIVTERMVAKLSSVFGALAVFLAAIGLYGVMAYAVSRRTSEIGLRMALGAQRSTVAWMIVREILILVAWGSLVGVAAAFGLSQFVSTLIFGLEPADPLTFVASTVLLLLVGLLAGYLPARRASRIDPIIALRYE